MSWNKARQNVLLVAMQQFNILRKDLSENWQINKSNITSILIPIYAKMPLHRYTSGNNDIYN